MSETDPRLYPARPFLAASIAVMRDGRVLLARRTRGPGKDKFALPGSLVETGETMAAAALRELKEETGVEAEITGFNAHSEVILRDATGRVQSHYAIASYVGHWRAGEGQTGPEAGEIVWASAKDCEKLDLTDGLGAILARARLINGGMA